MSDGVFGCRRVSWGVTLKRKRGLKKKIFFFTPFTFTFTFIWPNRADGHRRDTRLS